MKFSATITVFRKELLDVLRDRRTLTFMLIIPTVSIPVLMWLMTELMTYFSAKMAREQFDVLVLNPEAAPRLVQEIQQHSKAAEKTARLVALLEEKGLGEEELSLVSGKDPGAFRQLLRKRGVDLEELNRQIQELLGTDDFDPTPKNILDFAFPPNFRLLLEPGPEFGNPALLEEALLSAVKKERIAAAIRFSEDATEKLEKGDAADVTVFFLESSDRSSIAKDGLARILKDAGTAIVAERLKERGLPANFAAPIKVRPARLPGPGLLVKLMSQLLPYLIILFAFLGAMYPAIDLGAGEKERGTLETLLVAPVSRLAIVSGKFGVILVAAMVSAILATISLAVSLRLGVFSRISLASGGSFSFSLSEALTAILLVVPVGCIFSALLLALSMFAKSFKEAQSYASPLQTVIILPAFVSFLPGIKLDWVTASIPVVNVSIALKEIFTGNLDQYWGQIAMIFVSTSACAALLLWFAAWWSRRESVLFRS